MLPEQEDFYRDALAQGYDLDKIYDPWNDTLEKRKARAQDTVAYLKSKGIGGGKFDWQVNDQGRVVAPNGPGVEVYDQFRKKDGSSFTNPISLLNQHLNKIM